MILIINFKKWSKVKIQNLLQEPLDLVLTWQEKMFRCVFWESNKLATVCCLVCKCNI